MKKFTPLILAFIFAVTFFCCKDLRNGNSSSSHAVVDNGSPIADNYQTDHSKYEMNKEEADRQNTSADPQLTSASDPSSIQQQSSSTIPVMKDASITLKEARKDVKHLLKKSSSGDGDDTGVAIGLLLLIILLSIAALVLIIWLIAVAANNTANQTSNGSGSNSTSGNGGGGGGNNGGGSSGGGGSSSGCYIATMVYGDYDAPEVLVLRRFRDEKLAHSKAGRAFISWYYSWSPGFVKKYSHLKFVHRFAKFILDRFIRLLSR